MLVSTVLKCRIGKNLSYPIGAESISRVFEDLPQTSKSTLSFVDKPTRASWFNDTLKNQEIYDILVCRIESEGHTDPKQGTINNISWHLTVYPVLRELKSVANQSLESQGLSNLRSFLIRTSRTGDKPVIPYFSIQLNPNEETIDFWPKPQDE